MTRFRRRSAIRTSRQKGLSQFVDNFSLVSGMKTAWKPYKGLWSSAGSNAISTTAASEYPIYGIGMSRTSPVTVSAGVTGGTGLAFWVTDANSWFATVNYNTSTTSQVCDQGFVENTNNPPSGSCCSSTNSRVVTTSVCDQTYVENTSNPPSANCCSGLTYTPPQSAYSYSYTYGATYNAAYSYSYTYGATYNAPYSYSYSYAATYTAPSSYSYQATAVYTPQSYCCGTTQIAKSYTERINGVSLCYQCSGPCSDTYSFSQCCPSGTTKSGASCYYPASTSYTCPNGGSLSGGYVCVVNTAGGYSCPSGGSLSGTTCYVTVNVAGGYSCPSGGSLSGTTCTVNVSVPAQYSCPSGGSLSGSTCTVTVNVAAVPAKYGCYTTTRQVNTTYYSCYTSNRSVTTYNYYLRLIQSSGGAVSSVGNDLALSSQAAAIKIQVSGNSVVSTAYSDAGMNTSLGSRTDNFISPAQTKIFGIIKSPSAYNQGLTVTNFNATI